MSSTNHSNEAMLRGGNQLLEIIHKQVPYDAIVRCRHYLRIQTLDLVCLHTWLQCQGLIEQSLIELAQNYGLTMNERTFHDLFQRTLRKIRSRIQLTPSLDETGQLRDTFSFIAYEVYQIENTAYKVVTTSIKQDQYWGDFLDDADRRKYHRIFIFVYKKGEWKQSNSTFAKQYMETYKKVQQLIEGS
jgi:hypothetical protein